MIRKSKTLIVETYKQLEQPVWQYLTLKEQELCFIGQWSIYTLIEKEGVGSAFFIFC